MDRDEITITLTLETDSQVLKVHQVLVFRDEAEKEDLVQTLVVAMMCAKGRFGEVLQEIGQHLH